MHSSRMRTAHLRIVRGGGRLGGWGVGVMTCAQGGVGVLTCAHGVGG